MKFEMKPQSNKGLEAGGVSSEEKEVSKEEVNEMIDKYKILWKGQKEIEDSYSEYIRREIMPLKNIDYKKYEEKLKEYWSTQDLESKKKMHDFVEKNGGLDAFTISSRILNLRKKYPEIPEESDDLLTFKLN